MGAYLSSGWDFSAALAAGNLRVIQVDATRLLRLTCFPKTEPYWGKGKASRFDDPAQVYGVTYTALYLEVAFAETILHQKGYFTGNQWLIDEANIRERKIVTSTRPVKPNLRVADFTGVKLKALGLQSCRVEERRKGNLDWRCS